MYNGANCATLWHLHGRAEVPASPPKKRSVPEGSVGEGKAQMKHLVSAYLVARVGISHNSIGGLDGIRCMGVCGKNGGSLRRSFLAPVKFAAQRLRPGHDKVAHAHWDAALDQHLVPVPTSPTPAPAEFEPPALAAAARLPPKVARHP